MWSLAVHALQPRGTVATVCFGNLPLISVSTVLHVFNTVLSNNKGSATPFQHLPSIGGDAFLYGPVGCSRPFDALPRKN
jgi:hypothetical protein